MTSTHKYPRGVSNRPPGATRPLRRRELFTLIHVGGLVILASWAMGGNAAWARTAIAAWGSLGVLLTISALGDRDAREAGQLRPARWLWPLGLLNLLVLASALNPSFHQLTYEHRLYYVQNEHVSSWPSAARPDRALRALWFFDAVYLACFNLVLTVRRRRGLRWLLVVVCGNAAALAVFGTIQKLLAAKGPFFGLAYSPQSYFFASFYYHNHWGAFIVLMLASSLGLIFHFIRRRDRRDFWHSPAFAGTVVALLLAASVPLSGSRSCTVLVALVLAAGFAQAIARMIRQRRVYRESIALPVGLTVATVAVAGWFAYDLARPVIAQRLANTEEQVATIRREGSFGQRPILYRDTWHMARDRLVFGWGMASYAMVFNQYNTQNVSPVDGLPSYYNDAHCDWLQSLADVGVTGTALLVLSALIPFWSRRKFVGQSPLTLYLLFGCGLLLLYAGLEFPFGNGAVIVAFWICFFTAIHYGRIETSSEASGEAAGDDTSAEVPA